MSEGKIDTAEYWKAERRSYESKSFYLVNECSDIFNWIDPVTFYRNLFPEGFLETEGQQINWDCPGGGKPNAIAILITDKTKRVSSKTGRESDKPIIERRPLTDHFEPVLLDLIERSNSTLYPLFMSPVSYFGKARSAANARYLHAFAVDIDGVGLSQLENLVTFFRLEWLPVPTELVLSGRGVHLYYRLEKPVPLIPRNVPALQEIKRHLIDLVWISKTSSIPSIPENNQRQYQGIFQAFRVPGSATRLSGFKPEHKQNKASLDYKTLAFQFKHKDPYIINDFIEWLSDYETKREKSDRQKVIELFEQSNKVPLSVAKEKWPDWYECRVVNGEPRKTFTYSRACYDKWLNRIAVEVKVGCRYNRIMTLAAYAAKCGVSYEELEEDALTLFESFNEVLDSTTHKRVEFELSELYGALDTYYDSNAVTYTNAFMSRRAALPIAPGTRRNGRSREQHLKIARFTRDLGCESRGVNWWDGCGRPLGSKDTKTRSSHPVPKKSLIREYAAEHPDANHSDIARALGVSRPTVIKWLKTQEET